MLKTCRKQGILLLALTLLLAQATPAGAAPAQVGPYVVDADGFPVAANVCLTNSGFSGREGSVASLSRDGEPLKPGSLVATGQALEIRNADGDLMEEREVAVLGDVLGTGMAGEDQVARIARALAGAEPLEGVWLVAGDLDGSGRIDLQDLVLAVRQARDLNARSREIARKTVPLRFSSARLAAQAPDAQIELAFLNGQEDIPYVSAEDAGELLSAVVADALGGTLDRERTEDGVISVWTRENGSSAEINFKSGQIWFGAMSSFFAAPGSACVDALDTGDPMFRRASESFEREGRSLALEMEEYAIRFVVENGVGYMPLQTFSDVFLSGAETCALYNREGCFLVSGGNVGAIAEAYYGAAPGPRSVPLAEFSYNELCMALDLYYGLKEQHDISSFADFFEQTGLASRLMSADPKEADRAIFELAYGFIGDLHSSFICPSFYSGRGADCSGPISPSYRNMLNSARKMITLRAEVLGARPPAYQEIGDAAFVTFDSFTVSDEPPTYTEETLPSADDPSLDTIGLLKYAHKQITREDSPVQKVIMDLSCNMGGESAAAIAAVCWFLGKGPVSLNYLPTGAQATTVYEADLNGDGEFDAATDSVRSLKRYCLTSEVSFSCGNLVPAAFKDSREVSLVGRTTGGGANVVHFLSTASGTVFRVSGPMQVSSLSNGSFYDVDRGVAPDVPITQDASFYDREFLSASLSELLR